MILYTVCMEWLFYLEVSLEVLVSFFKDCVSFSIALHQLSLLSLCVASSKLSGSEESDVPFAVIIMSWSIS